jgi:hypothetical protein
MRSFVLTLLSLLTLLGGRIPSVRADSPRPAVRDEAGLFGKDAVAKAEEQIRDLQKRFDLQLVIETVEAVPQADQKRIKGLWHRKEQAAYFKAWAREKAEAAKVDGVYVLICNEPQHVQVIAWPERREEVFDKDACDEAYRAFTTSRTGTDAALLALVAKVREKLEDRQKPTLSNFWKAVLVFSGGVVAVWLVLGLVRWRLNATRPAAAEEGPREGRLLPGLLGGMFGAVAGYWIYDKLFHGKPAGEGHDHPGERGALAP